PGLAKPDYVPDVLHVDEVVRVQVGRIGIEPVGPLLLLVLHEGDAHGLARVVTVAVELDADAARAFDLRARDADNEPLPRARPERVARPEQGPNNLRVTTDA